MMLRPPCRPTAIALLASLLLACAGGGDGTAPPAAPVLTTIAVNVSASSVLVGKTITATAAGRDQKGGTIALGTVSWSSSAPSIASVDAGGVVTGVAAGTAQVIATAGGRQGTATVVVALPAVASITLTPATGGDLAAGRTLQLSATLKDAEGNTLTGRTIAWNSSDPSRATVSGSGLVAAAGPGPVTITAAVEGQAATTSLFVVGTPVANVDRTGSYAATRAAAKAAALMPWRDLYPSDVMETARAAADFDGDGVLDAFVAGSIFLQQSPTIPARFFRGAGTVGNMTLTDVTTSWMNGPAPRINHGRKALVAELNGDSVKDVFVCAHGYDAAPFPGTTNALLLSGGGRWSLANQSWSSYVGFHHGCSAADIDNDGDVDIFVANSQAAGSYFLVNAGSGSFTQSRTGIPAALREATPIFVAEMFDLDDDGFVDLLVGGDEFYNQKTTVYWGSGSGTFSDARATIVPAVAGWQNVLDLGAEDLDGDGKRELVISRTKGLLGDPDFYKGYLIQVLRVANRGVTDVSATWTAPTNASASTAIRNDQGATWVEWTTVGDFDGDGRPDLIGSDRWLGAFWARNTGSAFATWAPAR